MEKLLKRHDKERLRRAMLEQEETFRLQVHELHRLYRVQNQLMKEMNSNNFNNREQYSINPNNLEVRSPGAIDLQLPPEIEAESDIVLTLSIGSSMRKRTEAGNTSDSAGSYSSSSAESGTKIKTAGHGWGISPVRKYEFDMKQPPWVLPCLSLSMSSLS